MSHAKYLLKNIKQKTFLLMGMFEQSKKGFTVVELLIVIAISAVIFIPAIVSYTAYTNAQTFNSVVLDMTTMLKLAQSSATSQVKPNNATCNNYPLDGYVFQLCSISGKCKSPNVHEAYEVDAQCNGQYFFLNGNPFPNTAITLANVTTGIFLFPTLGSAVTTGSFDVTMGTLKKTITVQNNGIIQVQ